MMHWYLKVDDIGAIVKASAHMVTFVQAIVTKKTLMGIKQ